MIATILAGLQWVDLVVMEGRKEIRFQSSRGDPLRSCWRNLVDSVRFGKDLRNLKLKSTCKSF